ncbi:MAG: hypothetical protein AABZ53_07460 [Planctomycetota bacterium]
MISIDPAKVEEFVSRKLDEFVRRSGISLAVSGRRLEDGDQVTVYVRPHDQNVAAQAFVGELASIEDAAETEFRVSVVLVPDYAVE